MMSEYSHESDASSIAVPQAAKTKKDLCHSLFQSYILFFIVIFLCVFFLCRDASAEVYERDWRWYSKSEKSEYVRGLYEGAMFTLRSVYVFDSAKINAKYAQLFPVMTDITYVVQMIDDFYKTENTEEISVSWALYIIAQKQQAIAPHRLIELKNTAISDYHAVRS